MMSLIVDDLVTLEKYHNTIHSAFCENEGCGWTHSGPKSRSAAETHAFKKKHTTGYHRELEIIFEPKI